LGLREVNSEIDNNLRRNGVRVGSGLCVFNTRSRDTSERIVVEGFMRFLGRSPFTFTTGTITSFSRGAI